MSINHYSVPVTKTAHYSTYGNLNKKTTKYIWISMHGYGQLASRMIKKFDFLDPDEHFVIAAEGLNRFYWDGKGDRRPVACWMTSENRYDEIENFTTYLQSIYDRYCRHVNQKTKIIFLGFSQGCATMWRWIHSHQPNYDIAINWAGWVPEDISYKHLKGYFADKQHYLLYGSEDHFITEKALEEIKSVIEQNQLDIDIQRFNGGHKIVQSELEKFCIACVL
ncbi:MAG: dienelactone hydrolase family protein [Saprospiraceae bacterium]|nr:dienelactone hydrolase family protein [Saprospiraceae bacterium]